MASPQKEDGYTAIANEIIDRGFFKHRIPGEQMLCLWVIIRKTYGYNKKWDMIANSQFVKLLGLKKQSVNRAIQGLVDKNMISVSKKAYNSMPSYCFNKNYKTWKLSAKKLTVSKSADNSKQKSLRSVSKKAAHKRQLTKDNVTKDIVDYLNKKTGKSFKADTKATKQHIKARISEGFKEDDFYTVIDNKCATWLTDAKMREFLRPQTLFGTKFESYLQHTPREGGHEIKPTTYAQAQDAERRETVKILKEMQDAGKSEGDSGGAPQIEHLLPGGEEVSGGS